MKRLWLTLWKLVAVVVCMLLRCTAFVDGFGTVASVVATDPAATAVVGHSCPTSIDDIAAGGCGGVLLQYPIWSGQRWSVLLRYSSV